MKFSWEHYLAIALMFVIGIGLYHFGIMNIVFPGTKTLSKKAAKRASLQIATIANVAQQNLNSGTVPASLSAPTPLPVFNTWSGELDIELKVA